MDDELVAKLQTSLLAINSESGLRFQFYGPRGSGETAIDMSTKMFTGPVYHYAALVAGDTHVDGDKVGYYGQKFILEATQLGLGTCWVASTYDSKTTRVELDEGERLWDVVPLGYATEKTPIKQRTIRAALRKGDKKPEELVDADMPYQALPTWFKTAIETVIKGPSAVNGQPVVFSYHASEIRAGLPHFKREIDYNDLGIAKLQFEIAAATFGITGTWEWGTNGRFVYSA